MEAKRDKLFAWWVILYWSWLRNQRKWWKWLRASIQWFIRRFRWRYAIGLLCLFWGNVPDAAFEKRHSTKIKNTCKYKPKGKGDVYGVWYMYLDPYLCKLCVLYLLGLQHLLQPQNVKINLNLNKWMIWVYHLITYICINIMGNELGSKSWGYVCHDSIENSTLSKVKSRQSTSVLESFLMCSFVCLGF